MFLNLLPFWKRSPVKTKWEGDILFRVFTGTQGAVTETDPTQTGCKEEMIAAHQMKTPEASWTRHIRSGTVNECWSPHHPVPTFELMALFFAICASFFSRFQQYSLANVTCTSLHRESLSLNLSLWKRKSGEVRERETEKWEIEKQETSWGGSMAVPLKPQKNRTRALPTGR